MACVSGGFLCVYLMLYSSWNTKQSAGEVTLFLQLNYMLAFEEGEKPPVFLLRVICEIQCFKQMLKA